MFGLHGLEHGGDVKIPFISCELERRIAVVILGIRAGALLQQVNDDIRAALFGGQVKNCLALCIALVQPAFIGSQILLYGAQIVGFHPVVIGHGGASSKGHKNSDEGKGNLATIHCFSLAIVVL